MKKIAVLLGKLLGREKSGVNEFKIHYNNKSNELNNLCKKHGCDKGYFKDYKKFITWKPHNYTDLYYFLFSNKKLKIKNVFELGIGTNKVFKDGLKRVSKPGASLRVWRDFFKNSNIYAGDIDPKTIFNERRIKTFIVDQFSSSSVKKMWKKIGVKKFDLIIDDGCHQFDGTINFFKNSINYLDANGFYIIEDIYYKDKERLIKYFENKDFQFYYIELSSQFDHKDNNLFIIRK